MNTEHVVVGSGVAGLRAAIDLAQTGLVTILTKADITESNSMYAQGGIAAAIGGDDDVGLHYEDTVAAGAGLCEPEAVRVLVQEGPGEIERLVGWEADFEKEGEALLLMREGGHRVARIVHGNGGLTGAAVVRGLLRAVQTSSNIDIIPFASLRDIIVNNGGVVGVEFQHGREIVGCSSRSVLISTGGGCQIFRETTNPITATGDGIAAAYRAGAELRDIEFIQFHPTVLSLGGAPRFLLTEALRGEGARIVDEQGERFVDELRTRDEVSRAVHRQMVKAPDARVFLDVTHLPAETVRQKFRHVFETCLRFGLDITRERIPITPAAHYFMGGVATDLYGRTNLRGLYAAGEAASTGVHGANRLASNSLLEALVFGARAAKAMCEENVARVRSGTADEPARRAPELASGSDLQELLAQVRQTTWEYAGIIRNAEGLRTGADRLWSIRDKLTGLPMTSDEMTVQNLAVVAGIVHEAALAREESRGAHYRADFPDTGEPLHSYMRKGCPAVFRSIQTPTSHTPPPWRPSR